MSFTATYNYSFHDFMTLIRARRSSIRLHGTRRYVVLGVVLATVLTSLEDNLSTMLTVSWWRVAQYWGIIFSMIVAMFWLIDQFFDRIVYKWIYQRQPAAGMALQLTFSDDVVEWSGPGRKGRFEWQVVTTIVQQPDAFVLFIGSREGIVLPVRSFDTPHKFVAAYEFARDRIDAKT